MIGRVSFTGQSKALSSTLTGLYLMAVLTDDDFPFDFELYYLHLTLQIERFEKFEDND